MILMNISGKGNTTETVLLLDDEVYSIFPAKVGKIYTGHDK